MIVRSSFDGASLKGSVSEDEWKARVELAALYRLVALYGWDDLIETHISARVPGPEHHFLLNPYGLFWDEISASSLVKVDLNGTILQDTPHAVNPAGFTIHSAVHMAVEKANFVMHLHSEFGMSVSAQVDGLLPLSQFALSVINQISYHDYEGIAFNLDERERLVADLGDKPLMILRNHGTLSLGATAGDCFRFMYNLEQACRVQIHALSAGRDKVLIAPQAAQLLVHEQTYRGVGGAVPWPGLLRRIDRLSPGYDV